MKTITTEQYKTYKFIEQMKQYNKIKTIAGEKYQVQKYTTNIDITTLIRNINLAIYKKWCN
ncbi:hypothetical protein CN579_00850 [Bacillus toyonensis]|nr:hypothetical protein CN579_00850 [Bacillus toyonensis]